MPYCPHERRDFPDGEFDTDEHGTVWHKRPPRHITYVGSATGPFPDAGETDDFPDAEPFPPADLQ